jgi:ABC-type transport system involved in multi-copper enzyme maturation permease subunit
MNFAPLVHRELKVQARKNLAFQSRFLAAVATLLLCFVYLSLGNPGSTRPPSGTSLFYVISILLFAFALFGGLIFTVDAISMERREGTLSLLFLTDLEPIDFILAKMAATSVIAVYTVLAVFPLLSLCLFLGGISFAQVLRASVCILSTLLFSLSLCLWISSRHVQQTTAVRTALAWLLAITGGPWLLFVLQGFHLVRGWSWTLWLSPAEHFLQAIGLSQRASWFWFSILLIGACSILFLWLAHRQLLYLASQDARDALSEGKAFHREHASRRPRALEKNPVAWALGKSRTISIVAWILAAGSVISSCWSRENPFNAVQSTSLKGSTLFIGQGGFGYFNIIGVALKILFAAQVQRLVTELQRDQACETLLTTPLTIATIVQGVWKCLWGHFKGPTILYTFGLQLAFILHWISIIRNPNQPTDLVPFIVFSLYNGLEFLMSLLAIGWMGMFLALRCNPSAWALPLNLFFVLLLPMLLVLVPNVLIHLFIIGFARSRLLEKFRLLAARDQTGLELKEETVYSSPIHETP